MKKWLAGLFVFLYMAIGAVASAQPQLPSAPVSSLTDKWRWPILSCTHWPGLAWNSSAPTA